MAVIASVQSVSTAKTLLVFCFDVFVATIVFFIITPKVKYNYLSLPLKLFKYSNKFSQVETKLMK